MCLKVADDDKEDAHQKATGNDKTGRQRTVFVIAACVAHSLGRGRLVDMVIDSNIIIYHALLAAIFADHNLWVSFHRF